MGNWRRVHIVGGMLAEEVDALRAEIYQVLRGGMFAHRYEQDEAQMKKFGPLSHTGGICGFGSWPSPSINAVGNLAERDYDPYDVAEHLKKLAVVAPSLGVMVHCGADYESEKCIATVVLFEGATVVRPPAVRLVGDLSPLQMENNILRQLIGPYNRTL
jgi:hypothetical protein